jgi:hypothetical protein
MQDEYEALRDRYDAVVKDIVPKLSREHVQTAVDAVNSLIRLHKPMNWAMSDEPRAVLGISSDKETVVYGEVGRIGMYHAVPFDKLQGRVSGMLDKAKTEYEANKDGDSFHRRATSERVQHVEGLLEDLVALRQ